MGELRAWPTLGARATIGIALALFAAVFALRASDPHVVDSDEILFVVPIALLALRFGLRGGLTAALLGLALVGAWDLFDPDVGLAALGYLSYGAGFLLLGTLLGAFVDHRRQLEAEIARNFDASLDLLGTANLTGQFTRVNAAWERLLGHSTETICSRPFIDFVHPEDREATIAEAAALAEGTRDTVRFRNRYRAADGSYRWLEWSAHGSPSEGAIHVVGLDIRVQREAEQQLANHAELLEAAVAERTRELDEARAETLIRLAYAAEYRDEGTFEHTERVGSTSAEIAARLGLGADQIKLLREAAPLHDVGKLAISDTILLKPGKLSAEEYEIMKTHAELGARLLSGSSSPVLQMAAVIAASHHERWDGEGYPAGLAGETIPLVGRVVAVADVFDALISDRPYKSAWPVEQAITEIQRGGGSQFDARVVDAFLTMHEEAASAGRGWLRNGEITAAERTVHAPRQRRNSPTPRPAPRSARYV
jgi:PAS domain S-box-containing protein